MGLSPLHFRDVTFDWSRPILVGVVNVTPDSFSDGGQLAGPAAAAERALALADAGAEIIDIGGESTRPGAEQVTAAAEIDRVVPVLERLAGRTGAALSVDTTKAEVARAALAAGAELVNDISGGLFDPALLDVTAAAGAALVLGHVRGRSLAEVHAAEHGEARPTFDDVAEDLAARLAALPHGLRARTIADPGLGFGKRMAENLTLTRRAGELSARLSCPVMVGPSRKRFLGHLTGRPVAERDPATIGAALAAFDSGAQLVRVHDVAAVADALAVYRAIREPGSER